MDESYINFFLWHRGPSLSYIALGHALLEEAKALRVGQWLHNA